MKLLKFLFFSIFLTLLGCSKNQKNILSNIELTRYQSSKVKHIQEQRNPIVTKIIELHNRTFVENNPKQNRFYPPSQNPAI